jgi:predicted DNA-binding protein with PD1-like motif
MRWHREDGRLLAKLEPGDAVAGSLLELARHEALPGASVQGIGAVNRARIGFYRPENQSYDERELLENLEVISLVGNIAHIGEEPLLHAHVALGRGDLSVIGGHLFEATVSVTLEVVLVPTAGRVTRTMDPRFRLNLLDLP